MSGQDLRHGANPVLEAALEHSRDQNYLGETHERELRERNLPPNREIMIRELVAMFTQQLRPRTAILV